MNSSRKSNTLRLSQPYQDAIGALRKKYGVTFKQVIEALLERDLLENEPEICEQCGIEQRPPNRFAGGLTVVRDWPWRDEPPLTAQSQIRTTLPWVGANAEGTVILPNQPMSVGNGVRTAPDAEIPPSQRPRPE